MPPGKPPLIYLDHAATTPVAPEVIAAMSEAMSGDFGNPSSRHAMGLAAERQLQRARQTIATRLAAAPEQLVFTSGGTEANALALLGSARLHHRGGHLLYSAVEHPSVIQSARLLEREGYVVEPIPVTGGGWVDPEAVEARLRPDTLLVALQLVNNETGVQHPVPAIARQLKARLPGCRLLVDAVQAFTALPTDRGALGADLLTLSAHKIRGPKGVGCLVLAPGLRLAPLWGGGDQEGGRRAGTENVPGILGLARAVELPAPDPELLARLVQSLLEGIQQLVPAVVPLGDASRRAPHLLCLGVPGVPSETLVNLLETRGVIASSGAACHSRRSARSHVLEAMAVPRNHGALRLSLSATTTAAETVRAAELIGQAIRELAPRQGR